MTDDFTATPLRAGRPGPTMPDGRGYQMRGAGSTLVAVPPEALWRIVTDPERLAAAIPGAETLRREDRDGMRVYLADVAIGVGFAKGVFVVSAEFTEEIEPGAAAAAVEPGAVEPGAGEPGAVEPAAVEPGAAGRGAIVLHGGARGPLGVSWGEGWVDFVPDEGGTRVNYAYAILIGGTVAAVGGRLLDAAANALIDKFFRRLARAVRDERLLPPAAQ